MATYADNGSYRAAIRTEGIPIHTDTAINVGDTPVANALLVTKYGTYYSRNMYQGSLVNTARLAYNIAHP